jgi:Holliday junction resolvasome RuvABC endonuclease subunit
MATRHRPLWAARLNLMPLLTTPRLVLGIDPGFATFGWAVLAVTGTAPLQVHVAGMGVLTTRADPEAPRVADNVRRCGELARALEALCKGHVPAAPRTKSAPMCDGRMAVVCAEAMSHPRSASAACKVAMTWGLIVANVSRRRLPFRQLSPQDIKVRVVGSNDASKSAVASILRARWGEDIKRFLTSYPNKLHEHAYDALAAATACMDAEE